MSCCNTTFTLHLNSLFWLPLLRTTNREVNGPPPPLQDGQPLLPASSTGLPRPDGPRLHCRGWPRRLRPLPGSQALRCPCLRGERPPPPLPLGLLHLHLHVSAPGPHVRHLSLPRLPSLPAPPAPPVHRAKPGLLHPEHAQPQRGGRLPTFLIPARGEGVRGLPVSLHPRQEAEKLLPGGGGEGVWLWLPGRLPQSWGRFWKEAVLHVWPAVWWRGFIESGGAQRAQWVHTRNTHLMRASLFPSEAHTQSLVSHL